MDRWEDADDGIVNRRREPQGRVAALGIEGYVRGGVDQAGGAAASAVQVLPSKREQQVQALQHKNAPAAGPPAAGPLAAAVAPSYAVPVWAGPPQASGAHLRLMKDGELIGKIKLEKACTLFGRSPAADVVLEHASVSRQHALVCFKAGSSCCMVMDLGSAHGTFISGQRLAKNMPTELLQGSELRFGASTRAYVYVAAPANVRRVRFADGGSDEQVQKDRLEQVIGYSDSKDFAARVGPRAAGGEGDQGLFAGLVTSVVLVASKATTTSSSGDGGHGRAKLRKLESGEGLALKHHSAEEAEEEAEREEQQEQQQAQQQEQQELSAASLAAIRDSSSIPKQQGYGLVQQAPAAAQQAPAAPAKQQGLGIGLARPAFLPRAQQLPRHLLIGKKAPNGAASASSSSNTIIRAAAAPPVPLDAATPAAASALAAPGSPAGTAAASNEDGRLC